MANEFLEILRLHKAIDLACRNFHNHLCQNIQFSLLPSNPVNQLHNNLTRQLSMLQTPTESFDDARLQILDIVLGSKCVELKMRKMRQSGVFACVEPVDEICNNCLVQLCKYLLGRCLEGS